MIWSECLYLTLGERHFPNVLVWETAVAKCHRLDGLSNAHLFLSVLEAGESEIRVLAWSGSAWGPSSRLPPTWGERALVSCSFYKGHKSHHGTSTLMTLSKPNYIPKITPANTILLGVKVSHRDFGGTQTCSPSHLGFKFYISTSF